MIPASGLLKEDFEIEDEPSYTYAMDLDNNRVRGYIDELEAVKQSVYNILNTERYQYAMYSWNYGIELVDLFGEPISYVEPELERRITEALTWDDRIDDVSDFEFEVPKRGTVAVSFTVNTTFGTFTGETEVNI